MTDDLPRYAPECPFPAYAFAPGRPHPTRDPQGHSYGAPEHAVEADWRRSRAFRFGIDLFNHGYTWEAHESWEGLWHELSRGSAERSLIQGLIQWTAAAWKECHGKPEAATRLRRKARKHLQQAGDLVGEILVDPEFTGDEPLELRGC